MNKLYDDTLGKLFTDPFWSGIAIGLLRIILIIVVGRLLVWLIHKSINRVVIDKMSVKHPNQRRRILTVGKLLKNTVSYITYFIMGLLVLSELGIPIAPLLGGAGIVGIAIGFGAQSLVKDVITGYFIVLEDQFAVGDTISNGKFKGKVEVIGMRTTRLINESGEVHIIPNNLINEITNFSMHAGKVKIDIPIEYNGNLHHIMHVVKQCADNLVHERMIGSPNVLGLQQFSKDEIVMRIEVQCVATYEEELLRYMNEQFKTMLELEQLQMKQSET